MPVLAAVQFVPLSVERNTPPKVAAKSVEDDVFAPLTARAVTPVVGMPEFTDVHLVPLLVERNTPPNVPAKSIGEDVFAPFTARART